jgi:RNA polymerase sigma-70 factor (sigma-E family)
MHSRQMPEAGERSGGVSGPHTLHQPYVGSFDGYVQECGTALARTAFLLTGDRQLAEDLVQTVLAKIASRWDGLVERGHPGAYVRQTLVRTAIGWHRRRWRAETPSAHLPDRPLGDGTSTVDTRDALRRALLAMPSRQRATVVLRFYEDLGEAEVARLLGCSVGTVKSQTAKGLARLRALLDASSSETQPGAGS